ncbi:MAG TPA: dihydrolipoyl dehydrogenase [Syntrophales bacterium]|nr:dihydrolipoyl dehydrogenase [Syntrophales bacterium]
MKEYDVIVIGAGVGLSIAFKAQANKMKVALIDKGNMGGTCVNVGCIPSKMLIYNADRIADIKEAGKFGIEAEVKQVNFPAIMDRMKATIEESRTWMKNEVESSEGMDFYNDEARFVDDYTLKVGKQTIKGQKIFIASGARPLIPLIKGLEKISYLTNENVINLRERPESMIIIGGGYVGVEYAHFFAALGTKVTVVQRQSRLLPNEEPEISEYLRKELSKRMDILTNWETVEVWEKGRLYTVILKNVETGYEKVLNGTSVLVAAGRVSNADLLDVHKTEVETNEAKYIKVDNTLLTNKSNIWALGDAIGHQMFTHAGDMEQRIAWHNATYRKKISFNFGVVPHAVFTRPQIAAVGLTEEEASKSYKILVGRATYSDVVMGDAMMEKESFAKAIVEKKTEKILGFHIIGPEAAILIQEVANAMARGGDVKSITDNMHIFPALSEIIPETLNNLE